MSQLSDKLTVTFLEERAIVAELDRRGAAEGADRSTLIRRAIRKLLFSMPEVPTFEYSPEQAEPITAE